MPNPSRKRGKRPHSASNHTSGSLSGENVTGKHMSSSYHATSSRRKRKKCSKTGVRPDRRIAATKQNDETERTTENESKMVTEKHALRNKRLCGACGSETVEQGTSSGGDELDIPGFYYDKVKKRYFKIAPNHSVNSVTRDSISKKEAEIQRKKDEEKLLKPSRDSQKKFKRKNLAVLLGDRTFLNHNLQILKDSCLVSNITRLKPSSSQALFRPGHYDMYCNLEHMQQMFIGKKQDEVLGLWSLKDTWVQRIQLLQITETPRNSVSSSLSVSVTPHHKVIIQSLNKVTDLCWAPMTGHLEKQTILYTTVCHTGYQYSLAMIRSMNSDTENERPIFLDYNLGKKATWTCAWNYHRQQFSVGSEKSALMLNIERRTMYDYNTNNSDPLSQTFSHQTGNCFYTGTRKGQILTFDLRVRSSHPVSTLVHKSSVGSLVLLQDDVSLLSSDFTGRVCLWDVRKRDTVVEYKGNVNQYTKLPVHVDETEHVVYTVGEDGYTRFWSLKFGTLLLTLPPPCAVSRDTIPSVQYSVRWGDRQGNAGLVMGLQNKLHFYGALSVG